LGNVVPPILCYIELWPRHADLYRLRQRSLLCTAEWRRPHRERCDVHMQIQSNTVDRIFDPRVMLTAAWRHRSSRRQSLGIPACFGRRRGGAGAAGLAPRVFGRRGDPSPHPPAWPLVPSYPTLAYFWIEAFFFPGGARARSVTSTACGVLARRGDWHPACFSSTGGPHAPVSKVDVGGGAQCCSLSGLRWRASTRSPSNI